MKLHVFRDSFRAVVCLLAMIPLTSGADHVGPVILFSNESLESSVVARPLSEGKIQYEVCRNNSGYDPSILSARCTSIHGIVVDASDKDLLRRIHAGFASRFDQYLHRDELKSLAKAGVGGLIAARALYARDLDKLNVSPRMRKLAAHIKLTPAAHRNYMYGFATLGLLYASISLYRYNQKKSHRHQAIYVPLLNSELAAGVPPALNNSDFNLAVKALGRALVDAQSGYVNP